MYFKLDEKIALTTDHSASSYGMPVLVVAGEVFGGGDDCTSAVRAALDNPADELNWLLDCFSGQQLVLDLCRQHGTEAIKVWREWVK